MADGLLKSNPLCFFQLLYDKTKVEKQRLMIKKVDDCSPTFDAEQPVQKFFLIIVNVRNSAAFRPFDINGVPKAWQLRY